MISINILSIPEYLHSSELYLSLNKEQKDEDQIITIPFKCYKENTEINTIFEFDKLIKCVQYFGAKYPSSIFDYYKNYSKDIIVHYLKTTSKESYEELFTDLGLKELFLKFLEIPITNPTLFISHYIISRIYDIEFSDKFIKYGLDNKRLFLEEYEKEYNNIPNGLKEQKDFISRISYYNMPIPLRELYWLDKSKKAHYFYLYNEYFYDIYTELNNTILFSFNIDIIFNKTDKTQKFNLFLNIDSINIGKVKIVSSFYGENINNMYNIFAESDEDIKIFKTFLQYGFGIEENILYIKYGIARLFEFPITIFNKNLIKGSIDSFIEQYNRALDHIKKI